MPGEGDLMAMMIASKLWRFLNQPAEPAIPRNVTQNLLAHDTTASYPGIAAS